MLPLGNRLPNSVPKKKKSKPTGSQLASVVLLPSVQRTEASFLGKEAK